RHRHRPAGPGHREARRGHPRDLREDAQPGGSDRALQGQGRAAHARRALRPEELRIPRRSLLRGPHRVHPSRELLWRARRGPGMGQVASGPGRSRAPTPETAMSNDLAQLAGKDLGAHAAAYDANKAILYALAVGAAASELDLVYERDLRVLPTFGCALGLWAVEAAGRLGAYDPRSSLHVAQKIRVHRPLPASGSIGMRGRVAHVYDKGKAALLEIEVESEFFTAAYTIFLPGLGGWGGDRGPSAAP